jgi:hypothetical protein
MPSGTSTINTEPPSWLRLQPVWCFALSILQPIAIGIQLRALSSHEQSTVSSWAMIWWAYGILIGGLVLAAVYGHAVRYIRVKACWDAWRQGNLLSSTFRARVYRDWLLVDTHYRYGRILFAGWVALTGAMLAGSVEAIGYALMVMQMICAVLAWCCRRSMQAGFAWASRVRDTESALVDKK